MANIVDTLLDLVREIEAGDWIDKRDVTKALGDAAEEVETLKAERDRLKEKIKSITRKELSGWMDDYEQGCVNGYNDAYDQLTQEGEV